MGGVITKVAQSFYGRWTRKINMSGTQLPPQEGTKTKDDNTASLCPLIVIGVPQSNHEELEGEVSPRISFPSPNPNLNH
jgi:hypothetical protein